MDWDAFRIILTVAREGSLVGAGRVLNVNHATVSRQLRRAEEQLGAKLFDRLSNGLFPTAAGEKLIAHAERIENEIEIANTELLSSDNTMEGALRISVPLNLVAYGLSGDLAEFQRLFPKVYLELDATDEPINFLSRKVDVVVRANNNPSSGLWGFQLATIAYSFYASSDFHRMWGPRIKADPQGVHLPYIALNDTDPWRDRDQLLRAYPSAVPVAETNGLDSVLPMVQDGIGAGRLGRFMGERIDDLSPLLDCDQQCNRTLWVLTHPDFRQTKRIRSFMEFLRERFAGRAHQYS